MSDLDDVLQQARAASIRFGAVSKELSDLVERMTPQQIIESIKAMRADGTLDAIQDFANYVEESMFLYGDPRAEKIAGVLNAR